MSSQSILAQVQSARISRTVLIGLLVGLFLGLALGLMVGWVWWPVEYTGGGVSNLSEPEQAAYLAAVADAYVAYSSPEAAAIAQERLAYWGADLAPALDAAIAYYAAQPGSGVRVSNLVALAAAGGAPVDVQNNPALAGATAPAFSGASAASAAATAQAVAPPPEQGGSNLLAWLLSVVTAVLLIGGGLYVGWWYFRRRAAGAEGGTADFEEQATSYPGPVPVRATATAASTPGAVPTAATMGVAADADYAFEHEADEAGASQFARTATLYYARPEQQPASARAAGALVTDDDFVEEEELDLTADLGATPDVDPDDEWEADADDPVEEDVSAAGAGATPKAAAGTPAPSPLFAARQDRYSVLDSYTAIYTAGMMDFDHTQNVANPQGAGYIGEYGFGIANRHGLLNNNLEQVVALEVYLFDKSEETAPVTTSRTLLSEYAHDKLYSLFEREKQGGDPIIAQPRTRFQLEGRQLLLDCVIAAVTYTREGIFQAVTVEMTLKRKG